MFFGFLKILASEDRNAQNTLVVERFNNLPPIFTHYMIIFEIDQVSRSVWLAAGERIGGGPPVRQVGVEDCTRGEQTPAFKNHIRQVLCSNLIILSSVHFIFFVQCSKDFLLNVQIFKRHLFHQSYEILFEFLFLYLCSTKLQIALEQNHNVVNIYFCWHAR